MAELFQQYFTAEELAERHRKSYQALSNERSAGTGVPFVKVGGRVLYAVSDVLAYEEAGARGYSRETVEAALASFPSLASEAKAKLLKHIDRTVKHGI